MINAKFSMGVAQNFPDLGGGRDQPLIGRDDPLIGEGGWGPPSPQKRKTLSGKIDKYYWAIDVGAL